MKRIAVIAVILCAVSIAGCRRHTGLSDLLTGIDAIICEHPDSAFAILSQADTAGAPESLRALFGVLSEKAADKCDIVHTDDSLISEAVRFYHGRNDSL